jgi:hypothetical protein
VANLRAEHEAFLLDLIARDPCPLDTSDPTNNNNNTNNTNTSTGMAGNGNTRTRSNDNRKQYTAFRMWAKRIAQRILAYASCLGIATGAIAIWFGSVLPGSLMLTVGSIGAVTAIIWYVRDWLIARSIQETPEQWEKRITQLATTRSFQSLPRVIQEAVIAAMQDVVAASSALQNRFARIELVASRSWQFSSDGKRVLLDVEIRPTNEELDGPELQAIYSQPQAQPQVAKVQSIANKPAITTKGVLHKVGLASDAEQMIRDRSSMQIEFADSRAGLTATVKSATMAWFEDKSITEDPERLMATETYLHVLRVVDNARFIDSHSTEFTKAESLADIEYE